MSAANRPSASPPDSSQDREASASLMEGLYSATTEDDDDDMDYLPGFEELDSDEEYEGAHIIP